ncbi:MAG: EF-hand domain-containing protein [Chromatiales bacterium]|nr:EF-hand domain-containing protein [Chromatiales bacterium]
MGLKNFPDKIIGKLSIASVFVLAMGIIPYAVADGGGVYSVHDTDKDGYLDRVEFEKFAEIKRKRSRNSNSWVFDTVDTDGDSKISEQEMVNALIENMKRKKEKNKISK